MAKLGSNRVTLFDGAVKLTQRNGSRAWQAEFKIGDRWCVRLSSQDSHRVAVDRPKRQGYPQSMVRRASPLLYQVALVIAISVALAASAFAHRMPAVDDQASSLLWMTGVTSADICGDTTEGAVRDVCLACVIAATADLPPRQTLPLSLNLAGAATVLLPDLPQPVARVLDLAHAPQGPPRA